VTAGAQHGFDRPRPLPASVTASWRADGLWSSTTVSDVVTAAVDERAVACVVDDEQYTFGTVGAWSTVVATELHCAGVDLGDRVLIQLSNSAELVVAVTACWQLGAIAAPVLPMFGSHELRAIVAQLEPAAVIAETQPRSLVADLEAALPTGSRRPARFCVGTPAAGWAPFPGAERRTTGAALPGFADPGACALVLFTSGTTAAPKGVRHDSLSLLAELNSYRRSAALSDRDVIFNPAPVAHIGALVISTLVPWAVGCPVVLQSRWDADSALDLMARERVTFAVGAPVFLDAVLTRRDRPGLGDYSIAKFQTGAAATSTELLRQADTAGITAWRAWGMTEAPTVCYGSPDEPADVRCETDGRVEPGSQVRAVDDVGRPVDPGGEGELLLRSPKQMMGYVDATQDDVRPGGWLVTGDLGSVDAMGLVRITGRVKDIVNRGGEKFSCRELEQALGSHPAVGDVAVLGVPEPRLGEQVIAYLTLRQGARDPGIAVLHRHLTELGVARQKHPVAVTVVDALPVTATGKIRKSELAARWAGEHP
jgi:acyl-CoA synthetase (AMP-forming)/AMP-acid ligase II